MEDARPVADGILPAQEGRDARHGRRQASPPARPPSELDPDRGGSGAAGPSYWPATRRRRAASSGATVRARVPDSNPTGSSWTVQCAWKPAGTCNDGSWRVTISGANGRKFRAQDIVAALEALGEDTLRSDADALAEGTGGTLADILEDARRGSGAPLGDLTVLSAVRDPYRLATPRRRREGEWFAEQWSASDARHLRGFHYKLIGSAIKPDGSAYTGAHDDWLWLKDAASAARWLGLVPFEDFDDRRNSEPVTHRAERDGTELSAGVGANFDAEPPQIEVTEGEAGEISIYPTLAGMTAEQPYILAVFGEKSSLDDELRPVAVELGADLYLETGEQSITHAHHIAARAVDDGRPLIVLTVTDCDPSGYQMPVSIARKLQALRDLEFPALDVDVIHVGLTPDQVQSFALPSSPLSDKDKRKARWIERMGVEQTELDSLLALHPGALARLVRDALAPYFDPGLGERVDSARGQWRDEAVGVINAALEEARSKDDSELAEIEARATDVSARIEALEDEAENLRAAAVQINDEAEALAAEIADINAELAELADEIDLDPPDVPQAELPDRPTDGPGMVLSAAWSWVEATRRLRARKAYEDDEDDW